MIGVGVVDRRKTRLYGRVKCELERPGETPQSVLNLKTISRTSSTKLLSSSNCYTSTSHRPLCEAWPADVSRAVYTRVHGSHVTCNGKIPNPSFNPAMAKAGVEPRLPSVFSLVIPLSSISG